MTSRPLAILAVLALAVAGCGGDDEPDATSDATTGAATATAGPTTEAAVTPTEVGTAVPDAEGEADATVTVEGLTFLEGSITVPAGSPVTFINRDTVGHTVTSGEPGNATGVFDESLPSSGEATITVDEPGTYAYFCQIHPSMTGELVVEAAG